MSAILGNLVRFFKPIEELGQTITEEGTRAGSQFSDVYRTLGRGAATGSTKQPSIFDLLGRYFRILGQESKAPLPRTDYSGGKTVQINPIEENPAYKDKTIPSPQGFPTKFVSGSTTIGAGIIGGTLVALNPGAQKTAQDVSKTLVPLGQGLGSITQVFANNPLLLVGGLILIGIVLLKK